MDVKFISVYKPVRGGGIYDDSRLEINRRCDRHETYGVNPTSSCSSESSGQFNTGIEDQGGSTTTKEIHRVDQGHRRG